MERTEGRKELETQRRLAEIRRVAFDLFAERGFAGCTLEAVASALGYTKPALYYYYRNKDELVVSLVVTALEEAVGAFDALAAASPHPRQNLEDLLAYALDTHLAGRGFFQVFHRVDELLTKLHPETDTTRLRTLAGEVQRRVMAILERGIAEGVFRPDPPAVLGGVLLALVSGIFQHASSRMLSGVDPDRLKTTVLEILMKGVLV